MTPEARRYKVRDTFLSALLYSSNLQVRVHDLILNPGSCFLFSSQKSGTFSLSVFDFLRPTSLPSAPCFVAPGEDSDSGTVREEIVGDNLKLTSVFFRLISAAGISRTLIHTSYGAQRHIRYTIVMKDYIRLQI